MLHCFSLIEIEAGVVTAVPLTEVEIGRGGTRSYYFKIYLTMLDIFYAGTPYLLGLNLFHLFSASS